MNNAFGFVCSDGCGGVSLMYLFVLPLLGVLVVSGVIYWLISALKRQKGQKSTQKTSFWKIFLLNLSIVIVAALLFIVAPKLTQDSSWESRQQSCAEEAGYRHPSDDNSSSATAHSQATYRQCLES